ncbi:hypothetical protein [Enhygromyxa salina]|nr:hypothetical protein [Enhygromyxa salina]
MDDGSTDGGSMDGGSMDGGNTDDGNTDGEPPCTDCTLTLTELRAFPSAEGAGSITTGGRGGRVLHVTTLADSGAGSLRAALMETGPRTIVFDVSGRIHLDERIELIVENSDFTIAGQTAPEGGITISGRPLLLAGGYNRPISSTDNVIIRHLRVRNGSYTGEPDVYDHNGIISGGSERFIFDHLSMSFNDDQAISIAPFFAPLTDGTISRSIFSENATGIIIGAASRANPAERISTSHNLFVHQGHRTPNLAITGRIDVTNNVLFSWGSRLTNVSGAGIELNYIGNHMTPGSEYAGVGQDNKVQNPDESDPPQIYTAFNYHRDRYPTPQLDDGELWTDFFSATLIPADYRTTTQFPLLAATTVTSAEEARADVLADVGAYAFVSDAGVPGRYVDSYDTLRLQDVEDEVTRNPFNKEWTQPVLPENTRGAAFYDTLADIPEFFVVQHGVTSNDQVIDTYDFGTYQVENAAGYSALEIYLAYAAGDFERLR